MHDFFQISIFGIVLAFLIILIRNIKPEYAIAVSVAGTVVILFSVVSTISELFGYMKNLLAEHSVDGKYIETILKVCGISFVCSFAAETCRDSGATAVATTVEIAGRVCVFSTVMPLALSLTETVIKIINTNVF